MTYIKLAIMIFCLAWKELVGGWLESIRFVAIYSSFGYLISAIFSETVNLNPTTNDWTSVSLYASILLAPLLTLIAFCILLLGFIYVIVPPMNAGVAANKRSRHQGRKPD